MLFSTTNLIRALLAAIVFVGAGAAHAGGLGFRNDLKGPVIVQGATIANNMAVRRGPPILIAPGKVGWDNKLPPGVREITIHDAAQPNLILHRQAIEFRGPDQAFIIQMEANKITLKPYVPGN